jgi:DNA repair protein SbcC/Rad50
MKIHLENFKNHSNSSFEISKGVAITGRNGSGKTSILEAILYALYGRDWNGGLATDQYLNKQAQSMFVVLELNEFTLKRGFSKGKTTLAWDGKNIRHTDVLARLPEIGLAYSILNPLFLVHHLSPLELRSYFMQFSQKEDPVELFKKDFSDDPKLVERFKLGDYAQARARVKSLEQVIRNLEEDVALRQAQIFSDKAQLEELARNRIQRPRGVLKREQERQSRIEALSIKVGQAQGLESDIQSAQDRLTLIKQGLEKPLERAGVKTVSELAQYYEKDLDDTARTYQKTVSGIELTQLLIKRVGSGGVCPVCNQSLIGVDLSASLERQLASQKSLKDNLQDMIVKKKDYLETALEVKIDIKNLKAELMSLQTKRSRLNRVLEELEELKAKQKGLSEEDFKLAVESEAQIKMRTAINQRIARCKEVIVKDKESIKNTKVELKEALLLQKALSPQGIQASQAKQVGESVAKALKEFFPDKEVVVDTVRENRTNDNFREVFDIRINGVYYMGLSFGERVLMGVILSLMLRRLVKNFPFDFMLLDEASVLSSDTLRVIKELVAKDRVGLIYTKASESDLTLEEE